MKLSSCDVTSCNDLWDRFCFSRKGRIGGGGWVHPKVQNAWPPLRSALEMPRLALSGPLLSSYARTGWENSPLALHGTHFWQGCRQHGHLWAPLWKLLGWLWVGHCCPPMHEWVEKTVLLPCMAPISSGEACIIPVWASDYDYCQLVNGWVWFESRTCRGWL